MKDLLNEPGNDSNRDDYLLVTLMDNGALLDPMGKLRDVYPNALHIERPFLEMKDGLPQARKPGPHQSELDLFKDFFNEVTREPLSPEQENRFYRNRPTPGGPGKGKPDRMNGRRFRARKRMTMDPCRPPHPYHPPETRTPFCGVT